MTRNSHVGRFTSRSAAPRFTNGNRGGHATLTAKHTFLTESWMADVAALEAAIGRFTADRPLTNDCQVVFFEMGREGNLHVNVTHRYQTLSARGWAGPASLAEGFVHNRVFSDRAPSRIVRHIRDMVFAPQDATAGDNLA